MTPPTSRTWSRRAQTPIVRVRGRSRQHLSIAALTCYKPGERTRLIYRPAPVKQPAGRKGFAWNHYRDLLIAAHKQLDGPIVLIWDNLNTHARAAWGLLAETSPDKGLRRAAQEWGEQLDKRTVGIGLDEQVFRAVREYANGVQAAALTGVDSQLLGDVQRDYRRSGIDLPTAQRERLRVLFDELVELGSGYMATLAGWRDGITVDRYELEGLPETFAQNVARLERALAVRREIAEILGNSCWAAYRRTVLECGGTVDGKAMVQTSSAAPRPAKPSCASSACKRDRRYDRLRSATP
jgi:hypothetical protein